MQTSGDGKAHDTVLFVRYKEGVFTIELVAGFFLGSLQHFSFKYGMMMTMPWARREASDTGCSKADRVK